MTTVPSSAVRSAPPQPPEQRPFALVACGVLVWNIERIRARLHAPAGFDLFPMPAGLHARPRELRTRLQARIDELSASGRYRAVALGYGVCGRGAIGLTARDIPLVLPRVQDCIGIFLGSHSRYLAQFQEQPGTRYMTRGWFEASAHAVPGDAAAEGDPLYGPDYDEFARRYGEDNARYICEFRESWKRNYRRAGYIAFPGESEATPARRITEAAAESLGWEFTLIEGDDSLLAALVTGAWRDPRLLIVPPRHKTVMEPGGGVVGAVAAWDEGVETLIEAFRSPGAQRECFRSGWALGIDTGGTYTDAVLYDFDRGAVAAWAKAPTTHHDLAAGIREALAGLPGEQLSRIERVGLSTTLATNAMVENKGRPVGLLLMAPFTVALETFHFRLVREIPGAMSMEGEELDAPDLEAVDAAAREALALGCKAMAVSGFGSVVNPAHEQVVARRLQDVHGLPTVCGHELSRELNFMDRAATAAVNARLIPLIERLLDAVAAGLAEVGVRDCPLYVVRGDGSQMLHGVARRLPVETLLSGPAASVVGAAKLSGIEDAVAVDIGGTTLDVARIRHGRPRLSERGAAVGGIQTCVPALAGRTSGLGGDSEIDLVGWPAVRIGPRRILPICRLRELPGGEAAAPAGPLPASVERGPGCLEFAFLPQGGLADESRILEPLKQGPLRLDALARRLGRPGARYLAWQPLESRGLLGRAGLTLTDLLHVTGWFTRFDRAAASGLLGWWAELLDVDPEEIIEAVFREFRRRAAGELLGAALPPDCPWDRNPGLRDWLTRRLVAAAGAPEQATAPPRFSVSLGAPVIAVGAPAAALVAPLEKVLNTPVRVPENAAVANAVGAAAGDVLLRESATVRIPGDGSLVCSWRGGAARPATLEQALELARDAVLDRLRRRAAENGCRYSEPRIEVMPVHADSRDGPILLELTLTASLRG